MFESSKKQKRYFLVLFASIALTVTGCATKAEMSAVPDPGEEMQQEAASPAEESAATGEEQAQETAGTAMEGLQPVYFDFDRSFIRSDAAEAMKSNAEWLKSRPGVRIRIEGNCDERGTIEYNQALGQRRAASAKRYLTDLGISANRISLISYGKEKPACMEDGSEECRQKNRRDDFAAVSE